MQIREFKVQTGGSAMYTTRKTYNDIFDEMFRSPFFTGSSNLDNRLMSTNVQEKEDGFVLDMDLPGFNKENIQAELKDGYLTVTATRSESKEGTGKFIHKERFEGTVKRSFYVGDYLRQDDISASYNNGVLELQIPKEPEPVQEQPKLISIN